MGAPRQSSGFKCAFTLRILDAGDTEEGKRALESAKEGKEQAHASERRQWSQPYCKSDAKPLYIGPNTALGGSRDQNYPVSIVEGRNIYEQNTREPMYTSVKVGGRNIILTST